MFDCLSPGLVNFARMIAHIAIFCVQNDAFEAIFFRANRVAIASKIFINQAIEVVNRAFSVDIQFRKKIGVCTHLVLDSSASNNLLRTLPLIAQSYTSPIGPLDLSARAGRLVGIRFGAEREIPFHTAFASPEDQVVLDTACEQLDEYFAGRRTRFDVPIALQGTAFQNKVWSMLYRIPFGKMVSYRQMADALEAGCARSVGTANAANPLPIIIPCHRVIQSDGGLGGYAGGKRVKQQLLELEYAGAELYATAAS